MATFKTTKSLQKLYGFPDTECINFFINMKKKGGNVAFFLNVHVYSLVPIFETFSKKLKKNFVSPKL